MTLQPTKEMLGIVNARFTLLSDLRRNTVALIAATPEPARKYVENLIADYVYMVEADAKALLDDWMDGIREGYKEAGIDV